MARYFCKRDNASEKVPFAEVEEALRKEKAETQRQDAVQKLLDQLESSKKVQRFPDKIRSVFLSQSFAEDEEG
ncbi:MAG: hypothetical protein IPJ88_13435 [Myxococcales bacterium]|nr:MAG: hypothetical protein IPJ88_13435 [Myxococcales bacterium]